MTAEVEADVIKGVLDSSGIPAMVVGAAQFSNLGFEVRVPRGRHKEAEDLLEQAQEGGPEAAAEAEAAEEFEK